MNFSSEQLFIFASINKEVDWLQLLGYSCQVLINCILGDFVADSSLSIEFLKNLLYIHEIFTNSHLQLAVDKEINDFYKIYYTNFPIATATTQKFELKQILQNTMTPKEYHFFQKITPNFRKIEWFFGRLLAKIAIYDCLKQIKAEINHLNQLEISQDKSKKPYFKILHLKSVKKFRNRIFFSISHKQGNIVSVSSLQQPIGIDIERIQNLSPALVKKVFYTIELSEYLDFLNTKGLDSRDRCLKTGLWCIKEATSKAIGLGLAVDFRKINVKFEDGKLFVQSNIKNSTYLADIVTKGDYLIGLVRRIN